ncbi:hypothetical protein [Paludibaculum fermentans]|uniref:Uncharacterized protein n=1 Tax=Paludibaculum fermentans TaxID=1473598 RepID=A0A7S7SN61_PALFE|nr:hypothetical protein [Paludibaculum fermentans]QOY90216.1 hypothetical protein IRI77_09750 [Paludibaculum fermentans]
MMLRCPDVFLIKKIHPGAAPQASAARGGLPAAPFRTDTWPGITQGPAAH